MTTLVLYVALALGISFLCSILEATILSVTRSHIHLLVKKKKWGGRLLQQLKDDIDRPLAAILTLNTIANTVGAALVGAEVLALFGNEWVAVGSGLLTFSILLFSEIIPKTLGAAYWKLFAPTTAFIIQGLIYLLYPFVGLFRLIARLIKQERVLDHTMSREEMIVVAETGVEEGVLVEKEQRIIKNLLRLNAILVEDVMTPRSVVYSLQKDQTVGEVIQKHAPMFFSRIPVYDKSIDDIVGMVLRFKVIEASSNDREDIKIGELIMPVHSIPKTLPVARALDEFIKRREHLFVVTDDLGGVAGIITLEDAIETLLGVEIIDEFDTVADMRKFALEQWENRKKSRKYKHIGPVVAESELPADKCP